MKFAQISEKGLLEKDQVDCGRKWHTNGPRHCWSQGLSKGMKRDIDCFVANCENISLDFWKLLPIIKIAVAAIPMSIKLVKKIYSRYVYQEEWQKSLPRNLLLLFVFVPYLSFSVMSAMFLSCFLGTLTFEHTHSKFGAAASCLAIFSILRVIPAQFLRNWKLYEGKVG